MAHDEHAAKTHSGEGNVSLTADQRAHGIKTMNNTNLSNIEPSVSDHHDRATNPDLNKEQAAAALEAHLSSNAHLPVQDRAEIAEFIGKLRATGDQTHLKYTPPKKEAEPVPVATNDTPTKPNAYAGYQVHDEDSAPKTLETKAIEYQPIIIDPTPVPTAKPVPPSETSRTSNSVPAAEFRKEPRRPPSRTGIAIAAAAVCALAFITVSILIKNEPAADAPVTVAQAEPYYPPTPTTKLPPARVEIIPIKPPADPEPPPASTEESDKATPQVFLYGYKVKKSDVDEVQNTMIALSIRFGCNLHKLIDYNASSNGQKAQPERLLKKGATVWIPGDICTYSGGARHLHDDVILAYTVPVAEAPLRLDDLATRFDCDTRKLARYVREENPALKPSALMAGNTVFLPKMYCPGVEH